MSKSKVTWLFILAVVAVVVGAIVAIATVVAALAGGVIEFGGPAVVTVDGDVIPGAIGWLLVGSVLIAGGSVAAVISWVGALFNTARLADKTWFVTLLALGVFSMGWLAMIAYIFVGPDDAADEIGDRGVATVGPA